MNEMTSLIIFTLGLFGVLSFILWRIQVENNKTLRERIEELTERLEYWREQLNKYEDYLEDAEVELGEAKVRELEESLKAIKLRLVATLFAARYLFAKHKCSEYFEPSFFDMSDLSKEYRQVLFEDASGIVEEAMKELDKQLKEKS